MSLLRLEVEGFKSLKEVSWEPGALNVIIGPNGSGKSNLLDLLHMIRSAAVGDLSDFVHFNGGIEALVWDGRREQVRLNVEIEGMEDENLDFLRYELTLKPYGAWSGFRVLERLVSSTARPLSKPSVWLQRDNDRASLYDTRLGKLVPIEREIGSEQTLISSGSLPTSPTPLSYFHFFTEDWSIYGGLDTSPDALVRQAVLTRRDSVVDPDGDNLVSVLHTLYTENREFRHELNTAMQAAFGDSFEELIFPPAADQRVQLRVNWKTLKRSQPSAMLSDGTLRFLYLIAILANPEPPMLIAIEEPEVGLHPSMFPIIAEYAAQAAQKSQVIFTTHSADFLDAFRHAGVTPTTTVTQWRDGATTLKVLEGEELAYWLREYTLGQLFRSSELEQIG
jgi:predicted ATPase